MTTNSPNPVDGDVQALIRNIQRRIKNTKRWLSANKSIGNPESEAVELILIYETALAALTAEPVYQMRLLDGGDNESEWIEVSLDEFNTQTTEKYGKWERRTLYTTPPAHLLRPVELPDCVDDLHGIGPVMSADAVVEALHQQGYEVKND